MYILALRFSKQINAALHFERVIATEYYIADIYA